MTTTWAGRVPSAWPTSRRFERVGWHSRCYSAATPDELPARSRRLRSAPAARRVAARRTGGAADRHELGGGRRALDPARRRRRRDVPARGPRHGAGGRRAESPDRVHLRVWDARGTLAAAAPVPRAWGADQRVRGGHGGRALSRGRAGD